MLITSDHKFNLSQLSTWHHSLSCGAYPSVNKMGIHFHSNSEWDFDQLQWLFVGTHVYRYQNPNWRLITFFFFFFKWSISVGLRLGAGMQVKAPKNTSGWQWKPLAISSVSLAVPWEYRYSSYVYLMNVSCGQWSIFFVFPGRCVGSGCTCRCLGAGSCGMRRGGSLWLDRKREKKSEQCVEKDSSQICTGPAVFF